MQKRNCEGGQNQSDGRVRRTDNYSSLAQLQQPHSRTAESEDAATEDRGAGDGERRNAADEKPWAADKEGSGGEDDENEKKADGTRQEESRGRCAGEWSVAAEAACRWLVTRSWRCIESVDEVRQGGDRVGSASVADKHSQHHKCSPCTEWTSSMHAS
jgi:hypothetical protein